MILQGNERLLETLIIPVVDYADVKPKGTAAYHFWAW